MYTHSCPHIWLLTFMLQTASERKKSQIRSSWKRVVCSASCMPLQLPVPGAQPWHCQGTLTSEMATLFLALLPALPPKGSLLSFGNMEQHCKSCPTDAKRCHGCPLPRVSFEQAGVKEPRGYLPPPLPLWREDGVTAWHCKSQHQTPLAPL